MLSAWATTPMSTIWLQRRGYKPLEENAFLYLNQVLQSVEHHRVLVAVFYIFLPIYGPRDFERYSVKQIKERKKETKKSSEEKSESEPENDNDSSQEPKKKRARLPGGTVNPMTQWVATSGWEKAAVEWAIAYHNENYRPKIEKDDKKWASKVHHLSHVPSLMRRCRQFVGLACHKGFDNNTQLSVHLRDCSECKILPESVKEEFSLHLSNNYQVINVAHLYAFLHSITKADLPVVVMSLLPLLQALGFLLYYENAFMTPLKFYEFIHAALSITDA